MLGQLSTDDEMWPLTLLLVPVLAASMLGLQLTAFVVQLSPGLWFAASLTRLPVVVGLRQQLDVVGLVAEIVQQVSIVGL